MIGFIGCHHRKSAKILCRNHENPTETLPSEASKEKHRRTNMQVRAVWVFIHPRQNECVCIVGDIDTFHIMSEKERARAWGTGNCLRLCSCPSLVSSEGSYHGRTSVKGFAESAVSKQHRLPTTKKLSVPRETQDLRQMEMDLEASPSVARTGLASTHLSLKSLHIP